MHEAAEHLALPWKELLVPQIFNFLVFAGLLVFALRKIVSQHFSARAEQFDVTRKKAEQTKVEAERKHYDVQVQLRHLEQSAQKSMADAEAEAVSLKSKIIHGAKEAAKKAGDEVEQLANFEFQRAYAALKSQVVAASVQEAEAAVKKNADGAAKSRLNDEFTRKLQAAK